MAGAEERRKKRDARRNLSSINAKAKAADDTEGGISEKSLVHQDESDKKIAKLLTKNENELLNFVVKVNKVYQEKLHRPPPFMTFVICGMQSSGKSTIMERFMNAVLNIVQEGTGTRCPLDTTCIHDPNLKEPSCDLSGDELSPDMRGGDLSISDVFEYITSHNKNLADEDRFSTKPLNLIYRANNVQNMRFVDTPGIISNRGQGKDNRQDIQSILRDTMKRPNTKLCVLLEPKEFATNPIIDFCDETFSNDREWVNNSIFIMNKFDKQFGDSRSGSKAKNFFREFHENNIFPHLVMTPTLMKEDLPFAELFQKRTELLDTATDEENKNFERWQFEHKKFLEANPDDELLEKNTARRIGFEVTKKVMRTIMLEDTARRLPEVLKSLRVDLGRYQNKLKQLKEKEKFNDPKEVKVVMGHLLQQVQRRIIAYLDGDLETAVKSPHILQTLDDELNEEEDSEWSTRELNHFSEYEEDWREMLSNLKYPAQIQAEKKFHGGKQIQRAIETFSLVMIGKIMKKYFLLSRSMTLLLVALKKRLL